MQASSFKMYSKYCQNYDASEAFVKQKCKKKKEFESFVQVMSRLMINDF